MKNYYYNPKTRDLTIFDTESKEMLVLERIEGIRVLTSSEIDHPTGEPVKHWANSAYDPGTGKAGYRGERARKAVKPKKKCGYCHSTEHRGKDCPKKPGSSRPKSARVIKCHKCGETGHIAKTCTKAAPPQLPDSEIENIVKTEREIDHEPEAENIESSLGG